LDNLECNYTELNLDTVGRESYAYRAELYHMTGRTSVPAVWIGGEFIGACNDGPCGGLMKLKESGQLNNLIAQAGAK
jgi:glutaredoxin